MIFQIKPISMSVAVALCMACAVSRPLQADYLTFEFRGTVQNVFDGLGQLDSSVAIGTMFSGAFTFDPATPNTAEPVSEGQAGLYEHDAPPTGVMIDVGNFGFRSVPTSPDFDVIVNNDFGFAGSDDYGFISHNNEAIGLPNAGVADRIDIQWFAQSFNNPFDSVELPVTPPDLNLLGGGLLTIFGECTPCVGPAAFFEIQGTLIAFTPACDLSGDALCDVIDLDLMQSLGPIAPGIPATGNEEFDLNDDDVIDLNDRNEWLAIAATENGLGSPYKLGDANIDGVVDGQDFIAWNGSKFSGSLLWSAGDFNADGVVDGQDFILWNGSKFTSSDRVSAVPEPGVGTTLLVTVLLVGWARRR